MARPRPCQVCSQVFVPHPRAGDRQKTCSERECQRERHRRACKAWHDRNAGYDRDRRLREKLSAVQERSEPARPLVRDPFAAIPWDVVRDAVGLDVQLVLEHLLGIVVQWARDGVTEEVRLLRDNIAEMRKIAPRDAIAGRGPPA